MSPEESSPDQAARVAARCKNVSLSKWVNEPLPVWEQILCAHDVARLTRRPRWVLLGSIVLGRFPRMQRFHGRRIGWLRADILDWQAKGMRTVNCHIDLARRFRPPRAGQMALPLEFSGVCSARRKRGKCSLRMTVRG